MREEPTRRFGGLAALGLALLAGCQHDPYRPIGPQPGAPDPNVRLTPPQVADVQVAMGRTLEGRGNAAEAAQAYLEALKRDPNRVDAIMRLAILYAQQGQLEDSTELYNRALKLQPKNPDIFCNLGYSLYLSHHWTEAEQALRQCLALKSDHACAHNNLGLLLARTERDKEALAEFRLAGCSEADARANLAYAVALKGDLKQARQDYEQALALQPNSDAARKGLADVVAVSARMEQQQSRPSEATGQPASPWTRP
jgi:Tfp pilus assembly protein PilF